MTEFFLPCSLFWLQFICCSKCLGGTFYCSRVISFRWHEAACSWLFAPVSPDSRFGSAYLGRSKGGSFQVCLCLRSKVTDGQINLYLTLESFDFSCCKKDVWWYTLAMLRVTEQKGNPNFIFAVKELCVCPKGCFRVSITKLIFVCILWDVKTFSPLPV